ncbi:glycosyltransferase [Nocardioides sp.]|uniref:glycosyltransferase n=1 Tax=Nocardioides sp. TaxID=35761 RepID=UPI003782E1D8
MTILSSRPAATIVRIRHRIRPRERGHRPLYVRETAEEPTTRGQRIIGAVVLVAVVIGLVVDPLVTLRVLVALSLAFSIAYLGLRVTLVLAAGRYRFPPRVEVPTEELPRYTTLHPMYDEAHMIPTVVAAMEALDYPRHLLQCLLVLEERDRATVEAARAYPLPPYFQIVETPTARPYGKPKACDHALRYATGDYVVIFDAEDRPEPQQLRKAVETFRAAEERGDPLGCVQARLVFANQSPLTGPLGEVVRDQEGYDVRPSTWCSRFLGNEYAVHFELVLAGLSHLGLPVPLGGTSNHFPASVLQDVAFDAEVMPDLGGEPITTGAWDPWNVTEDAELGGAIAAHGYTTALFDSWTDEEAPVTPLAALNQRSRWLKGFLQTTLVLLRRPWRNARVMGPVRFTAYLMQVGGTYFSLFLAPLSWALTIAYVIDRPQFIRDLFPGPLLYPAVLIFVGGNLLLVSISIAAALRRREFGAIRYLMTLSLPWWLLLSAASWTATLELVFPHWRPTWNKTAHGVRYATRRRRWWLAFTRWLQDREIEAQQPHPHAAPLPALAPAPLAAGPPVAAEEDWRVAARERAEASRRAAKELRTASAQQRRDAITDRRTAARAANRVRREVAKAAPDSRGPIDFGAGVDRQLVGVSR